MKTRYYKNEYVEFWIDENGFLINRYKPHVQKITLEMAKVIVGDRLKQFGDKDYYGIVDPVKTISMTTEARKFLSEGESMKHLCGVAILVNNFIAKLSANTYMFFDKPSIPTKVFQTHKGAVNWLLKFKK